MRTESQLKPDLLTKKDQLELFKSVEQDVQAHRHEFENMRDTAQKISHSSGDSRTASYAGQMVNRYQALAAAVKVTF